MAQIAKVVVDLSLDREFDYLIPAALQDSLQVGAQVVVPFGHSETRGYVVGLADRSEHGRLKPIKEQVGSKSLVAENILELAKWMADYYASPVEHAVRTVLPSAVRKKNAGFKEQLFVHPLEPGPGAEALAGLAKRAPKQAEAFGVLTREGSMPARKLARLTATTLATLRGLEAKGFASIRRGAVARDPFARHEVIRTEPHQLMPEQAAALEQVQRSVDTLQPGVVLLFGVTGSGKTEVYLQAIRHVLEKGQGAIVLVPEIALTPQTVDRFRSRFGENIAVLHSNLSEGERHDEWHRIHDGRARIVVGARSALFAPVRKLGLIIVDEEHEPTYKQEESPRYNARDVAVMRGRLDRCAVVLGSATPSLESYYNATRGKYALARLTHRVDHRNMPAMRIVDMRAEVEKEGRAHVISGDLRQAIDDRLARAEQTLLFLNRRGFATSLLCPRCGYVAQCDQCSVSMTYHKRVGLLRCHICGAERKVPDCCPNEACRDPAYRFAGIGTQRVEEVVKKVFPGARVERMDSDTMTRKDAYRDVLGRFRTGKIDILIGTQMIAKGLHFPNVTLVGVVFADLSLHIPDFRAGERTFQLLTQVAGRAGRGDVSGEVIVQTYTPFHTAVQAARRLDYVGFCDQEIESRRELRYPPFTHLVCMTVRGPSEERVSFSAEAFAKALRAELPEHVILAGPTPAPLARAKGSYRYQVMMRSASARTMTDALKKVRQGFHWPDKVKCSFDIDALSLL